MSDFLGFRESYFKSEGHSGVNSGAVSSTDLISPPPTNLAKQKSLNIPGQANKNDQDFHPRSLDIKKQLLLSFQSHGGVSKPQPRKNSAYAIKSNGGSDDESDGDDQGQERKRRDNINDKIQELLTLVPLEFFDESRVLKQNPGTHQLEQDAAIAAAVKGSGTKDGKPNKGQILTQSVEYIQHLQNLIDENNRKEVELTLKYKRLLNKVAQRGAVPVKVGHTSAERCLGEIGVGPLSEEYFKKVLRSNAKRNSVGSL